MARNRLRRPDHSEDTSLIGSPGCAVIFAVALGIGVGVGLLLTHSWREALPITVLVTVAVSGASAATVLRLRLARIAKTYCASQGWEYVSARSFNEHDALIFRENGETRRLRFRVVNRALMPLEEPRSWKRG